MLLVLHTKSSFECENRFFFILCCINFLFCNPKKLFLPSGRQSHKLAIPIYLGVQHPRYIRLVCKNPRLLDLHVMTNIIVFS